jgi:hypothetical protein
MLAVRSTPSHVFVGAAVLLVAVSGTWLVAPAADAAGTPTVTITPGPTAGAFTDGQTVTVSVGPNSLFDPYSRVVIIECADPRGTDANLPTAFKDCDGDTVQAETVLVKKDGSFSAPNYTMYAVPNIALEEQANWTPVCNKTQSCVLYVGEDYNDFSKPKVFSQPFLFTSNAPTLTGGTATPAPPSGTPAPTSAPASQSTVGASAAVSLSASTLAFTGAQPVLVWLAGLGLILLAGGAAGRRMARRRRP